MNQPAVIFDNVSKVYTLRHHKTGYLKETLGRALRRINPLDQSQYNNSVEEFWALRDVSFEIQHGESVGIIGPNGSGKSTSLKLLAGVIRPTKGHASLNGRMGALIEVGAGFHPELTGRENVFLNGSILGMSKAEIKRKFDSIVEFSELEKFIDTPVKYYSSGMYVRLGFSVAVHNEPEIMLVDEVLAVGDMSFQNKCQAKMLEMKDSGRTFILVSHSMVQIQALCSRVIMLNKGHLIADGPPTEVTGKYIDLAEPAQLEGSHTGTALMVEYLRLLDRDGQSTSRFPAGESFLLELGFHANKTISKPVIILFLKRFGITVYISNTSVLDVSLPQLSGPGRLTCRIPNLNLVPSTFDIEIVVMEDGHPERLAHMVYPGLLTVLPPPDLGILGCGLPMDVAKRGVVFARADWSLEQGIPIQTDREVI